MWYRAGYVLSIAQCQYCDRYFVEYAQPDDTVHFCRTCGTGRSELNYRPESNSPSRISKRGICSFESAR